MADREVIDSGGASRLLPYACTQFLAERQLGDRLAAEAAVVVGPSRRIRPRASGPGT